MRRRGLAPLFIITCLLLAHPMMAQSGAIIETIEIGTTAGVIGDSGDATLQIGDGVDDEVTLRAGAADPLSIWVNSTVGAVFVDPTGIVHLGHQSRARWSLIHPQFVPQATWTPIEYDFDPTQMSPDHFDEHLESLPGAPGVPWTFVALQDGYYQVNARTEFGQPEQAPDAPAAAPVPAPGPAGGVSIAIFKIDITGAIYNHSQGNNLQFYKLLLTIPEPTELRLDANNAPNVSDVVFLKAGEAIQIYAWWDAGFIAQWYSQLAPTTHQTYVSVHKLS